MQTPPAQRSLETSRENSYEKDDRLYYDCYTSGGGENAKHNITVIFSNNLQLFFIF